MPGQTQSELENYKWAIAKAEMECPACGGAGGARVPILEPETLQLIGEEDEGCSFCSGTGRVARFPELRAKCMGCHACQPQNTQLFHASHRQDICHGLGFVPKDKTWEDLATWIQVLDKAVWDTGIGIPAYNTVPAILAFESPIIRGDILGAFKAATEALGIEETP